MNLDNFLVNAQLCNKVPFEEYSDGLPRLTQKYVMKLILNFVPLTTVETIEEYKKILPDVLSTTVQFANILNVGLHSRVNLEDYVKKENISIREIMGIGGFSLNYVKYVGKLAKAAEALDHVEDYPSRRVYEENIVNIIEDLIKTSIDLDIELEELIIS